MMVACEVTARIRLRSSRSKPFMTDSTTMSVATPSVSPHTGHERDERHEAAAVCRGTGGAKVTDAKSSTAKTAASTSKRRAANPAASKKKK